MTEKLILLMMSMWVASIVIICSISIWDALSKTVKENLLIAVVVVYSLVLYYVTLPK